MCTFYSSVVALVRPFVGGYMYGEMPGIPFGLFYYFAGYIGLIVLAHYIRTYIDLSVKKTLLIFVPLFIVGYVMAALIFDYQTVHANLPHIMFLPPIYKVISPLFVTPWAIILTTLATYAVSYICIKLVSFFPRSKYIIG